MTWAQAFGVSLLCVFAGAAVYGMWRGVAWWLFTNEAADRRDEEHEDDPQTPARMTSA